MPSSQPKIRFEDTIIANIMRIMFYIEGYDKDSFVKDIRTSDAAERCLQRIPETAIGQPHLPADILPDRNWKAMRDLGNMLRHNFERTAFSARTADATCRLARHALDWSQTEKPGMKRIPHGRRQLRPSSRT